MEPRVRRRFKQSIRSKGNKSLIPEQVGSACCAQFAVSRKRVRQRLKEDYEGFRTWVVETEKSDAMSGRVMEF